MKYSIWFTIYHDCEVVVKGKLMKTFFTKKGAERFADRYFSEKYPNTTCMYCISKTDPNLEEA